MRYYKAMDDIDKNKDAKAITLVLVVFIGLATMVGFMLWALFEFLSWCLQVMSWLALDGPMVCPSGYPC